MHDTEHKELVPATDLAHDAEAMRRRMDRDGYLLMRGLLLEADVAAVRRDILAICGQEGWLARGGEDDGVVAPTAACEPPDPRYYQVYRQVISLESYNRLAHAEPLLTITSALLDADDVIPRPARLARLVFPQPGMGATPPHQDFPHEQGTANAYTTWIPLGPVDRKLGGLAVWPGSHRHGIFEHGFVPGIGGLGIRFETTAKEPRWSSTDFALGDVLVFHSMTVHKALPNRTDDQIRLSADFRYQRASEPMAPHMLQPSGGQLTWEDVYAGWNSDDLKHYWTRYAVSTTPFDFSFYERRDEQALAAAQVGDRNAIAFLRTISIRNPDPAKRQKAQVLLAELERAAR